MNLCFFLGKVLSQPTFDFLYKNSNISISTFLLETPKGDILQVYGYDDIADSIYQKINKNTYVIIEGFLSSYKNNTFINIKKIKKI